MNLKIQGKRLYFKIAFHTVILTIFIVCAVYNIRENTEYINFQNSKYIGYKQQQDSLINAYKTSMDSMKNANFILEEKRMLIDNKLDSVVNKQKELNKNYEKELNSIRNASLSEHSKWFYTKLDSIKAYYSQYWLDNDTIN